MHFFSSSQAGKNVIKTKLHALNQKKTCSAKTKNFDQKLIGTKRVFYIKRNEHGEADRFKADYDEHIHRPQK